MIKNMYMYSEREWSSDQKYVYVLRERMKYWSMMHTSIQRERYLLIYDAYMYIEREWSINLWCIHLYIQRERYLLMHKYRERDIYWYNIMNKRDTITSIFIPDGYHSKIKKRDIHYHDLLIQKRHRDN